MTFWGRATRKGEKAGSCRVDHRWSLAVAPTILVLALSSCAPVNEHAFDLQSIKPNCGRAIDVYTGYWFWERLFQTPHRMVAYRAENGELKVQVEEANAGSILSTMASVATTGMLLAPRNGGGCD